MAERLSSLSRARIINANSRKINRRIHAEVRLKERFALEYTKIKNIIDNGGSKVVLECRNGKKVHRLIHADHEIYFTTYRDEIKTFLTKEMIEKSYPEIFEPPKKKKSKKKKKKHKRKQPELIPASELFKDK